MDEFQDPPPPLCYHHIGGSHLKRGSEGASGYDLEAFERVQLWPEKVALVRTGLFLQIPQGMEGQVRTRSGLALKNGIVVLNSPGTIDSDYRGEVGVILKNQGTESFQIEEGFRIAQLVFAKVEHPPLVHYSNLDELSESKRGAGGFGSTGIATDAIETTKLETHGFGATGGIRWVPTRKKSD